MSENLKRAESLFNRIMNPNAVIENKKYRKAEQIDLPKKDPIKLAKETLSLIPSNHHILPYCWTIWHHSRSRKKEQEDINPSVDNYLQTTTEIEFSVLDNTTTTTSIGSIEQLWLSLSSIKKSYELPISTELLIFKTGINPVWEDPINTKGGRWVFRFSRRFNEDDSTKIRKRITLIWERLLIKTLTGQLIPSSYTEEYQDLLLNDICGLVLSVRKDEDIISIWNSNLNFKKNKDKLTNFQARRIICDSILRIIRECDLITQGSDVVSTVDSGSNERVYGVSFEYRLHTDNNELNKSNRRQIV